MGNRKGKLGRGRAMKLEGLTYLLIDKLEEIHEIIAKMERIYSENDLDDPEILRPKSSNSRRKAVRK